MEVSFDWGLFWANVITTNRSTMVSSVLALTFAFSITTTWLTNVIIVVPSGVELKEFTVDLTLFRWAFA